MKKNGIMLSALLVGLCFGGLLLPDTAEAASKVKIDKKHFPSKIFRSTIKEFDKNKDGYLSKKEREAVKRIELSSGLPSDERIGVAPVLDMKGLEYFTKTKELMLADYRMKNLKFDSLKKLEGVKITHCIKVDGKKSDRKYDFTKNKKLKEVHLGKIGSTVNKILFAKDNGIKKFSLKVPGKLKAVDLSRLSQLEELGVTRGSMLESLDLGKCPLLKKADISYNKKLTELDFSGNPDLEELRASFNYLTSLDISKNTKLKTLWIPFNYLSELDVSQNTELENLECTGNLFETLDISMLKNLRIFECNASKLKELNLKGNPELDHLQCHSNQLETLDLSANKKLMSIECGGNPIETLDLSMLLELKCFDCSYARLTSLDISQNEKLDSLFLQGNCIRSIEWNGYLKESLSAEWIESMQKTQLLPLADGIAEEGIPIDKEHFPDYALRYEVLADFDTNCDGILSEKESLVKQPLNLKKFGSSDRREIDCTGMEYLKGITEVKSGSGTTLINNIF